MARKAAISPRANAWFLEQIDRISQNSPSAATALVARLEEVRDLVGEWPRAWKRGKVRNTRYFTIEPFVLTLRRVDGNVEIIAMQHGRRPNAYGAKVRASKHAKAEELRKLDLARKILAMAEFRQVEIPGGSEYQIRYLVDTVAEDELKALVYDLGRMEEYVDFLETHGVYLPHPKSGW